jgi:hypothetical protein
MAKTAASAKGETLVAYCFKTKEKNVPMLNAVINVTNGKFIAQGIDESGNKMTTICSETNAKNHVKAGRAKAGKGFPKS